MLVFAYAAIHPDYGPTPNPWDAARSSSGSSCGSAVAVATEVGYCSLRSDTGGSIRMPAAYCGIVGLKPTYGRVSRHGGIPVSWSADHFGPMTRTAGDAAALLGVVAGEDPRDPTSGRVPVSDYIAGLEGGLAGKRIGISELYLAAARRSVTSWLWSSRPSPRSSASGRNSKTSHSRRRQRQSRRCSPS